MLTLLILHRIQYKSGTVTFLAAGVTFVTIENCLKHVVCVLSALIIKGSITNQYTMNCPLLLQRPSCHNIRVTGSRLYYLAVLFKAFYVDS